jgi:chaperonin GroEL (HSP60 family)
MILVEQNTTPQIISKMIKKTTGKVKIYLKSKTAPASPAVFARGAGTKREDLGNDN